MQARPPCIRQVHRPARSHTGHRQLCYPADGSGAPPATPTVRGPPDSACGEWRSPAVSAARAATPTNAGPRSFHLHTLPPVVAPRAQPPPKSGRGSHSPAPSGPRGGCQPACSAARRLSGGDVDGLAKARRCHPGDDATRPAWAASTTDAGHAAHRASAQAGRGAQRREKRADSKQVARAGSVGRACCNHRHHWLAPTAATCGRTPRPRPDSLAAHWDQDPSPMAEDQTASHGRNGSNGPGAWADGPPVRPRRTTTPHMGVLLQPPG